MSVPLTPSECRRDSIASFVVGLSLHCFAWSSNSSVYERKPEIRPFTTFTMIWREWKVARVFLTIILTDSVFGHNFSQEFQIILYSSRVALEA